MKKAFTLILFLIPIISFSQNSNIKHAWHWYFGYYAGIDFSSGIGVNDTTNTFTSSEGFASISDTSGNLLFFTNGISIWNKNHQIMPNGNGLLGGNSSTQGSLIIPQPNSSNLFYLFTASEAPGTNGMHYSIIDKNLDNGNGDITSQKNILLFAPSTEKLSSVNYCNDSAVWIVAHKAGTNEFYSYLLTAQGLDTVPIISTIGSIIDISQGILALGGQFKFSSNGKRAATMTQTNYTTYTSKWVELFDFDNQTGTFSNNIVLSTMDTLPYGIEFSFNDNLLYYSTIGGSIFQYDLSSNDSSTIINSKMFIYHSKKGLGALQKAPDGKIYAGHSQTILKASVINCPDSLGLACGFSDTSFFIGPFPHFIELGLPNFNCSYFRSVGAGCVTGISELPNNFIGVYPNPASTSLTIESPSLTNIFLYNILGKLCFTKAVSNSSSEKINVANLSRGIYFLNVKTAKGDFNRKVVLQ